MLAADPELGLARHAVDLFAHLVECGVDAALGLDIVGDRMFDMHARLMENCDPGAHAVDQFLARQALHRLVSFACIDPRRGIDQVGVGDQFDSGFIATVCSVSISISSYRRGSAC